MIYIDSSTENLELFIEKHTVPDGSVKIQLEYCLTSTDVSLYQPENVSVHENYYVYNLDTSSMVAGQYEYRIVDSSNLDIYESGLLYKQSDNQDINKNINQNIVYER